MPVSKIVKDRAYYRQRRICILREIIDDCITILMLSTNKIETIKLESLTNIKLEVEAELKVASNAR